LITALTPPDWAYNAFFRAMTASYQICTAALPNGEWGPAVMGADQLRRS